MATLDYVHRWTCCLTKLYKHLPPSPENIFSVATGSGSKSSTNDDLLDLVILVPNTDCVNGPAKLVVPAW